MPFSSAAENARLFAGVRNTCEEAGRDPATIIFSSALTVCVGRDEAEVRRRADAIGRDLQELRAHGVAVRRPKRWRSSGATPRPGPHGCTCRSSTCAISTTWI